MLPIVLKWIFYRSIRRRYFRYMGELQGRTSGDISREPGYVTSPGQDAWIGPPPIAFLERTAVAHFATVIANGDPYVVPNLFVYADGQIFSHTSPAGHFRSNIEARPRVCFEAAEIGTVFPYGEFECDSSVSYVSVIGFGSIRIEQDRTAKIRFFDRLMAKYSDPALERPRASIRASITSRCMRSPSNRSPASISPCRW